ncbi:MAG TPA: DUF222 domain-containing protein [Candidatus Dormibacteraeota bacterium]|nr:DUF222 domain-containing protein [Candidatus Dormibacteraeota bacterium]
MANVSVTVPPSPTAPMWVELIESGLRLASEQDLESLGTPEIGDGVEALCRFVDRARAESTRRLREFEERRGPAEDGAPSTVSWLTHRGRMSPGAAADLVCVSRKLPELPQTTMALRAGEIGYQHASALAHTAEEVGAEAVREAESDLLSAARVVDVRTFAGLARHFRELVDAQGALAGANRDHERSHMHLSQTLGGCWRLDGWLDVEGGALLTTALLPLMKPLVGERRTSSQRRAAALLELCRRQLDAGELPRTGGQKPHLVVSVPAATLDGEPGSPGAEIRGAGHVIGEVARRLACDSVITELREDREGRPVSIGEPEATVKASVRRKVIARDGGCRFPGCTRPVEWCDVHHTVWRSRGGSSRVEDLVLVCRFHHRCLHEGGWRIERGEGGTIRFVPPSRMRAP